MLDQANKQQFVFRQFNPKQDIPRLIQFFILAEGRNPEDAQAIEAEIEGTIQWDGHDPEQDRVILATTEDSEAIIAQSSLSLQLRERVNASIVVHPDWRWRGIGSALLERVRIRAGEYHASQIA